MANANAEDEDGMNASINITPLVDIFLVLLIIFMITSTVIEERQISMELPKAANALEKPSAAAGLVLDDEARMFLEGTEMDSAGVDRELRIRAAADSGMQVLIGADQDLPYRQVVRAVDLVKGAGIKRYALKLARAGT
jgi:biopolymer transport protein TolR